MLLQLSMAALRKCQKYIFLMTYLMHFKSSPQKHFKFSTSKLNKVKYTNQLKKENIFT